MAELNEQLATIARDVIREMRGWGWTNDDIQWSASGAILKHCEAHAVDFEPTRENMAAILALVKHCLKEPQEVRTDTIENICTSVDDKDIDVWLARNERSKHMMADLPGPSMSHSWLDEAKRQREIERTKNMAANTRFQAQHSGASSRVIDTEIFDRSGHPRTVQWFSSFAAAEEAASKLNETRGHASDEPRCSICGSQPAGGDPPRCASCHSKMADMHG